MACVTHPGSSYSEVSSSPHRLIRLLESNDVPLDADIPVIRGIISDNHSRLDALNSRLHDLPTAEGQHELELTTERDRLVEVVRRHTAIVSPIRRVPPELISEIFAFTPCTRRVNGHTVNWPPWRLGHICSSWRSTALSSPFLWSSIEIIWFIDSSLADIYPLSMIETQLLRSGNVPLEVCIDFMCYEDSPAESALIELLVLHCHRWVSFCIAGSRSAARVLEDVHGRVPQLKRFHFVDFKGTTDCISISVAPSLREIILTSSQFRAISPRFLVPWNQITRYCGVYSAQDQMNILEGAPNLEECGIGFTGGLDANQDGRVATLPHLRRLYVADACVLYHLTAPSLGALYLEGWLDALLPFLRRSSCQLTKLVMNYCQFRWQLVSVLRCLPKLEYFAIINTEDLDLGELTDLWTSMTLSGSPTDLCPSLTFLAVGYTYNNEYFSEAFFIMMRSRIQPTLRSRLSFLRIILDSHDDSVPEGELGQFAGFLDEIEGLDVAFLYTDDDEGRIFGERERILSEELTIGARSTRNARSQFLSRSGFR
ncbi:hypothetical protein B0H11DRAFT_2294303 [Mycena galericulata]|nr:hypothetical protein B0H11DRAFT_2294303 [Mycena galericulata]